MPSDREDTLKKAEKLLRQGKLQPAIAEYLSVVESDPADWMTANTLGDLYVRAGQADLAAVQYRRVAEHFVQEGFYPKAAAIYKKLLKLRPEDEDTQLQLGEISQKQGLLADAKAHLNAVAARRRARGDRAGAADVVIRLGAVDPNDFDARATAARTVAEMGDAEEAAARFRAIHDDLLEKDRAAEALEALREAVRLNPHDNEGRAVLAKAAVASGDLQAARDFLDPQTAGQDPVLLRALLEIELGSGHSEEARGLAWEMFAAGLEQKATALELAWSVAATNPDGAFVLIDECVGRLSASEQFSEGAAVLRDFLTRVPGHIPALLKFIEVCVDGGLESAMNDAQGQLADAYLKTGQAEEARVISEDLVAREPWEHAHIDRFRRALVMLKVPEPDMVIADRLSGQAPFIATDVFAPAEAAAAGSGLGETDPLPSSPAESAVHSVPLVEEAAPRAGSVQDGVEMDLTAALDEPSKETLDSVFEDFRDQALRQGVEDEATQQLTLARTYLQMGMADAAIDPLKQAARTPNLRFEAASTLGRLYRDRDEIAAAAEWLERAAEAPPPSVDEGRALIYDFGGVLEQKGETGRALAIFLELQSEAGEYRDVAARIERLSRVETGG